VPEAPATDPYPSAIARSIEVEVSDTQAHLAVDHQRIARLVQRVLAGEAVAAGTISLALVDDRAIHAVNRRHLAHDWPTDVLSFRLSDAGDPLLVGELVVSAERAAAVARLNGFDPQAELSLYVVHGLLHLCGYDDLTSAGADAMRHREGQILAREGLTNTFPLAALAEDGERESVRWPD
jgi:probable rRNA maturation factor